MSFIRNKYNQLYLWSLLLVSLASCKMQQKYSRPDLPLPGQFTSVSETDSGSIADISWDSFFTDTTLQALIRKGLSYNYDLQIALKHIAAAHEQVKQAKALQIPQVDLQVTGQITRPSDNSLNGITANSFLGKSYIEDYNANVAISWEADIWGKLSMQKQASVAQYLQTEEAAKAVQTKLISDIAQSYYNLLMLDEQLTVAKSNLQLSDSTLFMTQLQKDAGNVTGLAVEQAEAQRQATAILIPGLEQSIALQEHALCILTGDLPGSVKRDVELSRVNIPDNLSTGIPAAMVSRRPDVHAAELALIIANKRVGIAKASMYPSLNITLDGGLNSFKASNWFNVPASLFGLAAGGVVQPLIEHRTLTTKYKTARIQRDESVLVFRQSVLNAVGEVMDALVKADKLKQQQQISMARVETLNKAVSNAQLLFKSGMATYLEVITAQSNALQAQLDMAYVQKQRLGANIDLYRALGGGRN